MKFAAMVTALSGITGYLTVALLKEALQRPRPALPLVKPLTNFSLPSGHACSSFLLYALLGYFLWDSRLPGAIRIILIILLLLFSFFIGVTRIYLQLHYASDVVAGFFLAIFFTCMAFVVMERKKIILE
jgi:undecaprenyl-diphosphatase